MEPSAGAVNAAHLAARIIAISDEELARKVADERNAQVDRVMRMDGEVSERLDEEGL